MTRGADTCAAMALAVRRLSPVIITTWMPMLPSVCTASADSAFTVSAMANMAQSVPAEERCAVRGQSSRRAAAVAGVTSPSIATRTAVCPLASWLAMAASTSASTWWPFLRIHSLFPITTE